MGDTVAALWAEGVVLGKDGIYDTKGGAHACLIRTHPSPAVTVEDAFDPELFHRSHGEEITAIDVFETLPLSTGGFACAGEGGHGSDGFIAYLDDARDLVWVLYSGTSNPFVALTEVDAGTIVAESSAGLRVRIDVSRPLRAALSTA